MDGPKCKCGAAARHLVAADKSTSPQWTLYGQHQPVFYVYFCPWCGDELPRPAERKPAKAARP